MSNPPTPAENLRAAELRAQRARDQLHLTMAELQNRLDPRPRAQRAAREARIAGETAVAIAQENPAKAGGVAAGTIFAIGLFFGRHRIARLFTRKRSQPALARDLPPQTASPTPVMRTNP